MNMGNFEKLSVLVIVVIIVMILVVALYTWTGDPTGTETAAANVVAERAVEPAHSPAVRLNPLVGPAMSDVDSRGVDSRGRAATPTVNKSTADIVKDFLHPGDQAAGSAAMSGTETVSTDSEASTAAAPAPVVKEPRLHVVASGETIGKIAKLEYPGVGQKAIDGILKANPTVDPTRMAIGTKLLMPELGAGAIAVNASSKPTASSHEGVVATIKPGTLYVTRKGDTLPGLAKRAYRDGNQWHRIWVENFDDISDTEHLQPGMRLRIPVLN